MTIEHQVHGIRVNGVDLSYIDEGTGDPVVLVHGGYVGDFRSWRFQIGPFSNQYRTIAYSLRHNYPGMMVGDVSDYTPTVHAEDLAGLVKKLELKPAHIVASSYGCIVALLLARRHPELVRSLVLGEPALLSWLRDLPGGAAVLEDLKTKSTDPAKKAAQQGAMEEALRLFIEGVVGHGVYDKLPKEARQAGMDNAHLIAAYNISGVFSREDAKTIPTPTLLLTGDRSPEMYLTVADELASCMSNVERGRISAASHVLHSFNPSMFNETVLKFLSRH